MLISLSRKFIFVANLKTASTSIESALARYAEIRLTRSEWGKHWPLDEMEGAFPRLFAECPRSKFFVFAVIRDPIDWLRSLHRSHKSTTFEGTDLSTMNLSFPLFVDEWMPAHGDQVLPQTSRFTDTDRNIVVDYLIEYSRLGEDFSAVCSILGLPEIELGVENRSVDIDAGAQLGDQREALLRSKYSRDYYALETLTSRSRARFNIPQSGQKLMSNVPKLRPQLTRDDVIWAYRFILGREPESEDVIVHHLACGSRAELRRSLMASSEFIEFFREFSATPT